MSGGLGEESGYDPEPVRQKEETFSLAFREANKQGFSDSDSPATTIIK